MKSSVMSVCNMKSSLLPQTDRHEDKHKKEKNQDIDINKNKDEEDEKDNNKDNDKQDHNDNDKDRKTNEQTKPKKAKGSRPEDHKKEKKKKTKQDRETAELTTSSLFCCWSCLFLCCLFLSQYFYAGVGLVFVLPLSLYQYSTTSIQQFNNQIQYHLAI